MKGTKYVETSRFEPEQGSYCLPIISSYTVGLCSRKRTRTFVLGTKCHVTQQSPVS